MIHNKKGSDTGSSIIYIILAVIVFVFLVLGFTMGWNRIFPFINASNVDDVVKSCESSCLAQDKYSYCNFQKSLKGGDSKEKISSTCFIFANEDSLQKKYGVAPCPNIDCEMNCVDLQIDKQYGDASASSGVYDLSEMSVEGNCFI